MDIRTIPMTQLKSAAYNPRVDLKPSDPEYQKLKRSIEEFGFVDPIIWNQRTGNVVGGHQRLKVLKDLGYTEVTVSVVDLDSEREKALNIALNKIEGDWDNELLVNLLQELDIDTLDLTGFDPEDIDSLLKEIEKGQAANFLDEIIVEENETVEDDDQPYFPVSLSYTEEERAVIMEAVKIAKDKFGSENTNTAILDICKYIIEQVHQ